MKSIRTKFILGFLAIFLLFFFILNEWTTSHIESGNKRIIKENVMDLKRNSISYIQQSFLTHHFESDEIYFGQIAEELVKTLQHSSSSEVAVYSLRGDLLYSSKASLFAHATEDLRQALAGKEAYTITTGKQEASVLYSYPAVINGKKAGIVRFSKDFSALYQQSSSLQQTIFYITLAVFTAAFLFSYILSRHITIPLVKLTQASTEVMEGNLFVKLDFKRRDEIGRLAANFSSMIEKLRHQFSIIKQDRDRLERLNLHRKHFYDNVTHELKTPLTTIMGYADLIRTDSMQDKALFEKGMNHISDESRRLHELVLELLEMSKKADEQRVIEQVDVSQLLQDVCDSMAMKAKRYRKQIHCVVEPAIFVDGESDRLRQLFINLLDNAVKYSSVQSAIEVTATEQGLISIVNSSEELAEEQLQQLFDPYYQVNEESEEEQSSFGLGLSICKEIVKEHQGNIWIEHKQGKTNVSVEFGRAEAEIKNEHF